MFIYNYISELYAFCFVFSVSQNLKSVLLIENTTCQQGLIYFVKYWVF